MKAEPYSPPCPHHCPAPQAFMATLSTNPGALLPPSTYGTVTVSAVTLSSVQITVDPSRLTSGSLLHFSCLPQMLCVCASPAQAAPPCKQHSINFGPHLRAICSPARLLSTGVPDKKSPPLGAIIGGSVGGAALLLAVAAGFYIYRSRRWACHVWGESVQCLLCAKEHVCALSCTRCYWLRVVGVCCPLLLRRRLSRVEMGADSATVGQGGPASTNADSRPSTQVRGEGEPGDLPGMWRREMVHGRREGPCCRVAHGGCQQPFKPRVPTLPPCPAGLPAAGLPRHRHGHCARQQCRRGEGRRGPAAALRSRLCPVHQESV